MSQTITQNIVIAVQADALNKANAQAQALAASSAKIKKSFADAGSQSATSGKQIERNMGGALTTVKGHATLLQGALEKVFSPLGLSSLGIVALVKEAHGLNMKLRDVHAGFRIMSDATGDTSRSVGILYSAFGKTSANLGDIKETMLGLAANGLPATSKGFEDLTVWIGNLHVATGISASSFTSFMAGLNTEMGVSFKTTKTMTNAMIALGDGFGITGQQIEEVMKVTKTITERFNGLFNDVDKGAASMARGIGTATAAFKAFGVSTQKSGQFLQDMLDPEKIDKNIGLFSRLGMSYSDITKMMTGDNGGEMFLDKMMKNLPKLSKEISDIKDPIARLKFSQGLGLPLEIASKMAKATRGEISGMMTDYKNKAVDQKAIDKKEQKKKEDSQKFSDQMELLKMKIMMPLMQFANHHLSDFTGFLNQLAGVAQKLMGFLADGLETVTKNLIPAVKSLANGDMDGFWKNLGDGVSNIMKYAFEKIGDVLNTLVKSFLPSFGSFLFAGLKALPGFIWNHPIAAGILGAMAAKKNI